MTAINHNLLINAMADGSDRPVTVSFDIGRESLARLIVMLDILDEDADVILNEPDRDSLHDLIATLHDAFAGPRGGQS